MAALEVKGLAAGYGRARVLFGVDLQVARGEVAVLFGRNGAGKSTTLKAIMGLVPRQAGQVVFEGRSLHGLEPFEVARLGMGYVAEDRRLFTDLTVAENLEVGRRPGGHAQSDVFELFPALRPMLDRRAARMSGGEQQMLAIARTLMGNPAALLLDEPSEGLAPKVVDSMAAAVLQLKKAGLAILLCEQNLAFAERVADRAYLLAQGRVQAQGAVREMRDNLL